MSQHIVDRAKICAPVIELEAFEFERMFADLECDSTIGAELFTALDDIRIFVRFLARKQADVATMNEYLNFSAGIRTDYGFDTIERGVDTG